MTSLRKFRILRKDFDEIPELVSEALPDGSVHLLRVLGWISAGAGMLGLGLMVGRELRRRYKFTRRTPYDFYSHAGDEIQDMEFGVGI